MLLHELAVRQPAKMLQNLERWLEKAVLHAESRSYDPAVLLAARLAPDQFPLLKQIQGACDAAKFAAARVAGKQAPSHPDEEKTLDEIRARLRACRDYLATFRAEDFAGAEERSVELPFLPGQPLSAIAYLNEMALPNFYFHVVTAYAILRHNGVDLGKRDYIGSLPVQAS